MTGELNAAAAFEFPCSPFASLTFKRSLQPSMFQPIPHEQADLLANTANVGSLPQCDASILGYFK
jgi:hypothetical protein